MNQPCLNLSPPHPHCHLQNRRARFYRTARSPPLRDHHETHPPQVRPRPPPLVHLLVESKQPKTRRFQKLSHHRQRHMELIVSPQPDLDIDHPGPHLA